MPIIFFRYTFSSIIFEICYGFDGFACRETCDSRIAENLELQDANDRLAGYIDRLHFLEAENSRLALEVIRYILFFFCNFHEIYGVSFFIFVMRQMKAKNISETQTGELENIKQMFDSELSEVRKVLNEVANEKSRLEIHVKRLFEDNSNLQDLLEKATDELNVALLYEQRYNELEAKYDSVIAEEEKCQYDNQELKNEISELMVTLNDLRKRLEEEILVRVETENAAQSLREGLSFKNKLQIREINEYSQVRC